jgi:hypothetical protein
MLIPSRRIASALIATMLAGCAVSPTDFQAKRYEIGDTRLCKTWKSAAASGDVAFQNNVGEEVFRRGLNAGRCAQLEREQAVAIGAGILLGAAVIAAARNGGVGGGAVAGGGAGYASTTYDYDWEWDQFYNQNRALVWACRGIQTGQFAEQQHCAGKMMTDWKWPGK